MPDITVVLYPLVQGEGKVLGAGLAGPHAALVARALAELSRDVDTVVSVLCLCLRCILQCQPFNCLIDLSLASLSHGAYGSRT